MSRENKQQSWSHPCILERYCNSMTTNSQKSFNRLTTINKSNTL